VTPYYVREEDKKNRLLQTYEISQERTEVEHYAKHAMKLYLDATSPENDAVFYWCNAPIRPADKVAATAAEYLEQNVERPKLVLSHPVILRG